MRENQYAKRLTRSFALGLLLATASVFALALAPAVAAARPTPPKTVYAVTFSRNSVLYRLDPRSHGVILEGRTGVQLTDVTFQGKTLYAVSFADLYRLDVTTGASHLIGSLGLGNANALVTQPETGTLYGADLSGNFFKINPLTGHAAIIGSFGNNLSSAGDLTFANGHLYATVNKSGSSTSFLATVNVRTGAAKIIGNTGQRSVWGLVTGTGALYGATYGGRFLAISPATGQGTVTWKERIAVAGMAVPNNAPAAPSNAPAAPSNAPAAGGRNAPVAVPSVVGDTEQHAQRILSADGFSVVTKTVPGRCECAGDGTATGTVARQAPHNGTMLRRGSTVTIYVYGPPPKPGAGATTRPRATPTRPPAKHKPTRHVTPPPSAPPPSAPPSAPPPTAPPPTAPPTTGAKGAVDPRVF